MNQLDKDVTEINYKRPEYNKILMKRKNTYLSHKDT